jgi:hypothetical protein
VLHTDGSVQARAPDAKVYQASSFAKWLHEQAGAYEKKFPRTRLPFVRVDVVRRGSDTDPKVVCAPLEEAREQRRHVLLYFGRDMPEEPTKDEKKQAKAARKFEKGTLDSKKAAETAATLKDDLVLLRFDLGEKDHALLAARYGVDKAPRLVLLQAGVEEPELLKIGVSGASLAYRLKKLGE